MLAINFVSIPFTYRRLANGLSRFLLAFSNSQREILKSVVKAYQCTQCLDDIDAGANTPTSLTRKNGAVCDCLCTAGLKVTVGKCYFEFAQVLFLDRTQSLRGLSPQALESKTSSANWDSPNRKNFHSASKDYEFIQTKSPQDDWKF